MIIGLSLPAFTQLHVVISLIGIVTGFIAILGLCAGRLLGAWTALFLLTTVLTSVTGFMFHIESFGPPEILGAISLVVLAIALSALYLYKLVGAWRWIYVVTAVLSQYLNVFVGVVQSFQKIPALHPLAPTGTEPPFVVAQVIVLAAFVLLAIIAIKRFRTAGAVRTLH